MTILLFLAALSPAHAGSTIEVNQMAVDGVEVRSLRCELEKGGLMASLTVVSAIAGQKAALDACAPPRAATQVKWTWAGGATADVKVVQSSAPETAACVNQAMSTIATNIVGACEAVILSGPTEAAQAAAGALKPVE